MKDTGFLNQLASGPLLGSPEDNIESINNGAVGSQESIPIRRGVYPLRVIPEG